MPSLNRSMWSRLARIGLPFYKSDARRRALGGLAVRITMAPS